MQSQASETHTANEQQEDATSHDAQGDVEKPVGRADATAPATTDPLVGTQRRTDDPVEARGTPDAEVRMATEPVGPAVKSRRVAAVLGILLGALGAHRLYLGYRTVGLFQLLLFVLGFALIAGIAMATGVPADRAAMSAISFVAVVPIWGAVEGVAILLGGMNRDGAGRPLLR